MSLRMIKSGLWIGAQDDETQAASTEGVSLLLAAKEPWHRRAVGYTGRSCAADHPDYLWCHVDAHTLALNLIDAATADYIPAALIDTALAFCDREHDAGRIITILCNQSVSRAPSLALLALARWRPSIADLGPERAILAFRERWHPDYLPKQGMVEVLHRHWPTKPQGEAHV